MRTEHKNKMISFTTVGPSPIGLRYELQPIATVKGLRIVGYEVLFRGSAPAQWETVDAALLQYLARAPADLPRLFVNISHNGLARIPKEYLVAAHRKQKIIFELSEAQVEADEAVHGYTLINDLVASGLRFAIDDFGNGFDGLQRLYSINRVSFVKIDGEFILTAMSREAACIALTGLIQTWRCQGIATVAEKIETAEMLEFCETRLGVDYVQGFHIDDLIHAKSDSLAEAVAA